MSMRVDDQIVIAQKKLTLLLGGLAIAMPSILYIGNLLIFDVEAPLYALSTYYHSGMRDVFVGILFAMGVFLITYEGKSRIDRVLGTLAGFLAFSVALVPTHQPGTMPDVVSDIHNYVAAAFYGILTYFCLIRFTKIDKSRSSEEITIQRKIRNVIYLICGTIMVFALISLILMALLNIRVEIENPAFWLEYAANFAFGLAFFVKGEGIFFLNDDPISEMNPWEIYGITIATLLIFANGFVVINIFLN